MDYRTYSISNDRFFRWAMIISITLLLYVSWGMFLMLNEYWDIRQCTIQKKM